VPVDAEHADGRLVCETNMRPRGKHVLARDSNTTQLALVSVSQQALAKHVFSPRAAWSDSTREQAEI
jgi:hypothetical protein